MLIASYLRFCGADMVRLTVMASERRLRDDNVADGHRPLPLQECVSIARTNGMLAIAKARNQRRRR